MTSHDTDLFIDVTTTGDVLICELRGEVDASNAHRLTATLADHLRPECRRVTLDLDGLSFIDSSGLRVIIACQQDYGARDIILHVHATTRPTLRLLEITGLESLLTAGGPAAVGGPAAAGRTPVMTTDHASWVHGRHEADTTADA